VDVFEPASTLGLKTREREENESGREVVRDTSLVGGRARNYISGFVGSQAVPACPSGIGNAYYWTFVVYI
jgi:hypothetical protein